MVLIMFYCIISTCFIALLLITTPVNGKWAEDELYTSTDWKFITRFCFLSLKGSLRYHFEYPAFYGSQKILLYYDSVNQWSSVYKSTKNCTQRIDVIQSSSNAIIELGPTTRGCVTDNKTSILKYVCSGERIFSQSRERWWYIAASHCTPKQGEPIGIGLKYSIHMTNGPEGDYLHREYSADEFYILPIDIAFLIAYIVLSTLTIICAVFLQKKQLFHTTYKMYMVSVFMWTFYLFLITIAYGRYGNDGQEWRMQSTKYAARAFEAISILIFLLMLILLGKGYTITCGKLTNISTVKLTVFMVVYTFTYVVVFIWQGIIFDPGWVLYIYESPPGYAIIALRIIGFLWFCYSIFFTLKNHKGKGAFYYPLIICYTLWFWAGPIVIIIAMRAIALWTREKTVNGVENFVAFCGHIFFLILTRPSAANKNFPYHMKTSQIGVLQFTQQSDDGSLEDSNVKYSSQKHATTSLAGSSHGPDLTKLFLTDTTRSLRKIEEMSYNYTPNNYRNGVATMYPEPSIADVANHQDVHNWDLETMFSNGSNSDSSELQDVNHMVVISQLPSYQALLPNAS